MSDDPGAVTLAVLDRLNELRRDSETCRHSGGAASVATRKAEETALWNHARELVELAREALIARRVHRIEVSRDGIDYAPHPDYRHAPYERCNGVLLALERRPWPSDIRSARIVCESDGAVLGYSDVRGARRDEGQR